MAKTPFSCVLKFRERLCIYKRKTIGYCNIMNIVDIYLSIVCSAKRLGELFRVHERAFTKFNYVAVSYAPLIFPRVQRAIDATRCAVGRKQMRMYSYAYAYMRICCLRCCCCFCTALTLGAQFTSAHTASSFYCAYVYG